MKEQKYPSNVFLIRHGESVLNYELARKKQENSKTYYLDVGFRNADIPLTEIGVEQAKKTGIALINYPHLDGLIVSPYVRTRQTAEHILEGLGYEVDVRIEERIREKERGVIDKLTKKGIEHFYPAEFERMKEEGKYYYRAPGGENYPDVALRLYSFFDSMMRSFAKKNVAVIGHDITILMFRKVVEKLQEDEILELDDEGVKNCGIVHYNYSPDIDKLVLEDWNTVFY